MEPPIVCFESHMSWNSIFYQALSVLISVTIVLGNVSQPISCRCCVGVSCFPSLFFLLLTQKTLEKMDKILSKERFLLCPQRCFFGDTADLLHFMLHRILFLTSVKIVCCHNAIPHTLRDELMCGSFQLSIWRLTITRIVFLICSLGENGVTVDRTYHHSVRTWKARQKSAFGEKFPQRVRFWIKIFTTCQTLNSSFYNASDFELKFSRCVTF